MTIGPFKVAAVVAVAVAVTYQKRQLSHFVTPRHIDKISVLIRLIVSLHSTNMPQPNYRSQVVRAYLIHMILRDAVTPPEDLEEAVAQLEMDLKTLEAIKKTRYLRAHTPDKLKRVIT